MLTEKEVLGNYANLTPGTSLGRYTHCSVVQYRNLPRKTFRLSPEEANL